jgi:Leucine-rich repeat (LRR) protein
MLFRTQTDGTVSMTLSSQHLSRLDLSYNKIEKFEDAAFATLPSLIMLDLSHNNELEVYGRVFKGLENCLKSLKLNNISLIQAPELSLPNLRELEITHNELPTIPQELAANLTSIRSLDISFNDLPSVPLLIHSLPNLKELSIAGNPITSLTNVSFIGVADTLESLDIANLQLTSLEVSLNHEISNENYNFYFIYCRLVLLAISIVYEN